MTEFWGERLIKLRQVLKRQDLTGFIVPRADEHLGEYVPASAERLAWLTGFTGSAGLAPVLPHNPPGFSAGAYAPHPAAPTAPPLWEPRHVTEQPPHSWLSDHAPPDARIGYDPLLI